MTITDAMARARSITIAPFSAPPITGRTGDEITKLQAALDKERSRNAALLAKTQHLEADLCCQIARGDDLVAENKHLHDLLGRVDVRFVDPSQQPIGAVPRATTSKPMAANALRRHPQKIGIVLP